MKKLFALSFLCCIYFVIAKQTQSITPFSNFKFLTKCAYKISAGPVYSGDSFNTESFSCQEETNYFSDSTTDYADVAVYAGLSHPRTGFQHIGGILLECKNYNEAFLISLTVHYDTTAQLLFCNYTPVSSSPGTMTFYFDTLHGMEQKFISFEFFTPANSLLLGHELWLNAEAITWSHDLNPSNNSDQTLNKITGSMDPNIKSVMPEGFGFPHYVPVTQEEFKFTIDFQNTGTDTAFNISITDTLSSFLDPLTIQPGTSSHPYSWEMLSPGILKFHFTNILLPDSTTNEPRSHGFIYYTIKARQGLNIGTNIKNTAYIFFDFNSPVQTNSTTNELFDCNNIAGFSIGQSAICGGDTLLLFQNTVIPHVSIWYVDSNPISFADTLLFCSMSKGIHQVVLMAQTPYCTQTITQSIMVIIPSKPTITQNGYTLTSSPSLTYQWYLNGSAIVGAQAISYLASGSGWYSVIITDGNGCAAGSDSVFVTNVGMTESLVSEAISVSPNPFIEQMQITSSLNETILVELMDMHGRILTKNCWHSGGQDLILDTKTLVPGIYILRLTGEKFVSNRRVSKN